MHEHGLMTRLLRTAQREAAERGGTLRGMRVRLGALATSDEDHFRHELEHVRQELGLGAIALELELAPERPSGVELVSLELAE